MPNRKRSPPATRRRALDLLAASRDGCTEAIMLAHGFTIDMPVEVASIIDSSIAPGDKNANLDKICTFRCNCS
jgi:hypothetical protein